MEDERKPAPLDYATPSPKKTPDWLKTLVALIWMFVPLGIVAVMVYFVIWVIRLIAHMGGG